MVHKHRPCAVPGCDKPGEYSAPKNPRNIKERIYFCLDHVREYNKQWNGLDGFSTEEIFNIQHGGATWNRPTWKMGVENPGYTKGRMHEDSTRDAFSIFDGERTTAPQKTDTLSNGRMPKAIEDACLFFQLRPPLTQERVKRRYRELAKKYHPDLNQNDKDAEEQLKQVNETYKLLMRYVTRFDK